jgi:hypothetical protein
VPYAAYGEDMHEGQAAFTRPLFENLLGKEWLPSVPELRISTASPWADSFRFSSRSGGRSIADGGTDQQSKRHVNTQNCGSATLILGPPRPTERLHDPASGSWSQNLGKVSPFDSCRENRKAPFPGLLQ